MCILQMRNIACKTVQVVLDERRRLCHVGVTLTVLHPTEQLRAQLHAVKQYVIFTVGPTAM